MADFLSIWGKIETNSIILSYYGRYKDWLRIMLLLCKTTNSLFVKNKDIYLTKEKITLWDDSEDIEKYLELFSNKKNRLGENCKINLELSNESSQELLRLLSELNFPTFNPFSRYIYESVTITNLDCTSTSFRKDIAYFLHHCIPKYIKSLTLGGGEKYPQINSFRVPLVHSLPNVCISVCIRAVKLNDDLLQAILEGSRNCREITISDCILNLRKKFKISTDLEYKYTKVMLLGDSDKLNDRVLEIIGQKMALTNLKSTLNYIELSCSDCNLTYIQDLFHIMGFKNLYVHCTSTETNNKESYEDSPST
ncbi:unnamed protein product [Moneuplotes crassus]|uniref:Uncharacterized protein n=1 Tax=Euplotes crassus TaxID=5936 RepID=A0AAD1XLF8_EUPCR|nr:unnamed protein product [Moneuplotes crassus]